MTIIKIRWAPNRQNDALIGRYLVDQLWSLASLDVINVEQIYWFFQSNAYQTVGMICSERAIAAGGNQHSISFDFVWFRFYEIAFKTKQNRQQSNGKQNFNVISNNLKCHWHQVLQEPNGDIKSSDILEIKALFSVVVGGVHDTIWAGCTSILIGTIRMHQKHSQRPFVRL